MGKKELGVNVFVICKTCGDKHRLKVGLDAPIYWCGDILQKLMVGDEVEYDETIAMRL